MKNLEHKVADYIRFGQVLLAVSTLLMFGLLVPNGEKEALQLYIMMGTIMMLLAGSFFFFYRAKKLRQHIEGLNDTNHF